MTQEEKLEMIAREYLNKTDWIAVKSLENSTIIPSHIKEKRDYARTLLTNFVPEELEGNFYGNDDHTAAFLWLLELKMSKNPELQE